MKFSSHFIYNRLYIKNGSAFTASNWKYPQVIINPVISATRSCVTHRLGLKQLI